MHVDRCACAVFERVSGLDWCTLEYIVQSGDWESETKRFGYATVAGSPLEIEKFKATYAGTKWAGSVVNFVC